MKRNQIRCNTNIQTRIMAFFDVIDGRKFISNEETATGGILYGHKDGDNRWAEYWEAGRLIRTWQCPQLERFDDMIDMIITDAFDSVRNFDAYAMHTYRDF